MKKTALLRDEFTRANARGRARLREFPPAISARYNRALHRVSVMLDSGLELGFSVKDAEELHHATSKQLRRIEITPSGLGIHFPDADADIYLPALLEGLLGSRRWMAVRLGRSGGRSRSEAKAAAARANGKLGGRPHKLAG
jgi:hypothetical protein